MRYRPLIPALLCSLSLLPLAACGSGQDVATVGNVTISQESFNHWMETNARALEGGKLKGTATPDAPAFTNCVERQRKLIAGKGKPTTAALKNLCKSQYESLRQQTMQLLAAQAWVLAQADRQDLKAPKQQVDQQYKAFKQQLKTGDGAVSDEDLRRQAESTVLGALIRQKAYDAKVPTPSAAQLRAYYDRHLQQFATPASRDLNMLVAADRVQGQKAADALRAGQPWKKVFARYNSQKLWGAGQPLLQGATVNSFQPELRRIIFSAPLGAVVGPARIGQNAGFAVAQVKRAYPARAAGAYNQITKQVKQAYQAALKVKAADRAWADMQKYWQPKTDCSADYSKLYPCSSAKNPAGK